MDRFGEDLEFMALSTGFFEQIRGCRLTGEEKDLALWQFAASDDGCFYAGHAGHDDVADEHIGLKALQRLDGFFSAEDSARLETCLVEDNGQCIGNDLLVVGNENSGFCGRGC